MAGMRRHCTPPDTHAPQTLIESLVELNLRYESLHEEAARMREVRYCSLHVSLRPESAGHTRDPAAARDKPLVRQARHCQRRKAAQALSQMGVCQNKSWTGKWRVPARAPSESAHFAVGSFGSPFRPLGGWRRSIHY